LSYVNSTSYGVSFKEGFETVYRSSLNTLSYLPRILDVRRTRFPLDISAHPDIFTGMKNTVQYFKALADETRLRIMALLLVSGELCVCDITATLQLPQSTVSRHLAYLRNAGWVTDRREGVWIIYSVTLDSNMKKQLADVLKVNLPDLAPVAEDINKIASFSRGANCA